MSARPPQYRVVAVVAVLLAAAAVPSLGANPAAATAGANASFGQNVVYEQTGDVANITVSTSAPATVNLGSPAQGFWLQVEVGSGTTELRLNTYKAGETDEYSLSEMVWAEGGSVSNRTLRTAPIDAPLEPARYQMNVTIKGQEKAVSVLSLEERATYDITSRIAIRKTDVSEFKTAADLRKASMEPWNQSLARDDWLFLYVNASGVKGALGDVRLNGSVVRLDFEQTNPPMNGETNRFTGESAAKILTDPGDEGFYLAVDTGEHGIDPGDRYNVTFSVLGEGDLADSTQTVSTHVRVVERRVTVKDNPKNDPLTVENQTTIRGTTTLTPGTTINITARDGDVPPFNRPKTVTVGPERTFRTTFDFSDLEPGREFEIRFPDQKRTIPAKVKEEPTTTKTTTTTVANTTTATGTTTTTAANTTTTTNTTTTATTTTTAEGLTQVSMNATSDPLTQQAVQNRNGEGGDGSENDDSGGLVPAPGFGPALSLVALAAAALLAVRRG